MSQLQALHRLALACFYGLIAVECIILGQGHFQSLWGAVAIAILHLGLLVLPLPWLHAGNRYAYALSCFIALLYFTAHVTRAVRADWLQILGGLGVVCSVVFFACAILVLRRAHHH